MINLPEYSSPPPLLQTTSSPVICLIFSILGIKIYFSVLKVRMTLLLKTGVYTDDPFRRNDGNILCSSLEFCSIRTKGESRQGDKYYKIKL